MHSIISKSEEAFGELLQYITYRQRVDKVSSWEWEADQTGVADMAGFWHCLLHDDARRDEVMPEPGLTMPLGAGLNSICRESQSYGMFTGAVPDHGMRSVTLCQAPRSWRIIQYG